jgi:hypothetical protein
MASAIETLFWYRRLGQACAILLATSPFAAGKASGQEAS